MRRLRGCSGTTVLDFTHAGLRQPDAVRAGPACHSTETGRVMGSVIGYGFQGEQSHLSGLQSVLLTSVQEEGLMRGASMQ